MGGRTHTDAPVRHAPLPPARSRGPPSLGVRGETSAWGRVRGMKEPAQSPPPRPPPSHSYHRRWREEVRVVHQLLGAGARRGVALDARPREVPRVRRHLLGDLRRRPVRVPELDHEPEDVADVAPRVPPGAQLADEDAERPHVRRGGRLPPRLLRGGACGLLC
eukprot:gene10916-biopygen8521